MELSFGVGGEGQGEGHKKLVEGVYWGQFFQVGVMSKFLAGGTPPIPPVGKTLHG